MKLRCIDVTYFDGTRKEYYWLPEFPHQTDAAARWLSETLDVSCDMTVTIRTLEE